MRKSFETPDEWMGEEGEKFRQGLGYRQPKMRKARTAWEAFFAKHDGQALSDIETKIKEHAEAGAP